MIIRRADNEEVPRVAAACREYFNEIAPEIMKPYDADHCALQLSPCNGPDSVLVIATEQNDIKGVMYYRIMQNTPYQKRVKVATEIIWHTSASLVPSQRIKTMALLAQFAETELKHKGVRFIETGTRLDMNAAGRLLEKTGYTETARRYRKEIL